MYIDPDRDIEMGLPNPTNNETPSPSPSPRAPAVVMSNSGKALGGSSSGKSLLGSSSGKSLLGSSSGKSLLGSSSGKALVVSNSGKALGISSSGKSLGMSGSGKRMDGKKKYVKQVTGRHNDTELHLAAQRGDVAAVKGILEEIDEQMLRTMSGAEFDEEVAGIRAAVVNEVNELGETALFTAAEKGHINVLKELLPYATKEGLRLKNRSGFDALHIAASQGHQGN